MRFLGDQWWIKEAMGLVDPLPVIECFVVKTPWHYIILAIMLFYVTTFQ